MIGNRSAYEQRLTLGAGLRGKAYGRGARVVRKPYGEKIMRGGDDNTELARTSAGAPPPLGVARVSI